MPYLTIYHNPHFLDYNGDHSQIVLPTQPVASILVSAELSLDERLGATYARTQHGYNYPSWFHDPQIIPHLRSTAVGDLIADHKGNFYVVEHFGFQPYQPTDGNPLSALSAAYRMLETACMQKEDAANGVLLSAARQALVAMQHMLATEEMYSVGHLCLGRMPSKAIQDQDLLVCRTAQVIFSIPGKRWFAVFFQIVRLK